MQNKHRPIDTWLHQHHTDPSLSIPELHRQQMHLLCNEQHQALSKEVLQKKLIDVKSCGCLGVKRFSKMISRRIEDDRSEQYCRKVRKWLFECSVPFRTIINIHYDHEAIRTTWKLFIRYWPLFCGAAWDDILIVDHTYQWALSLCHESIWIFGSY